MRNVLLSWLDRLFGNAAFSEHVTALIEFAEPSVWELVDGRVPTHSADQVRGYVWARSAQVLRTAAHQICTELSDAEIEEAIQQSRHRLADRIVNQLDMLQSRPVVLAHAA